jgi:hypothetical protein
MFNQDLKRVLNVDANRDLERSGRSQRTAGTPATGCSTSAPACVKPPSTVIVDPITYLASSEARYKTASAIPSGSAYLFKWDCVL